MLSQAWMAPDILFPHLNFEMRLGFCVEHATVSVYGRGSFPISPITKVGTYVRSTIRLMGSR